MAVQGISFWTNQSEIQACWPNECCKEVEVVDAAPAQTPRNLDKLSFPVGVKALIPVRDGKVEQV